MATQTLVVISSDLSGEPDASPVKLGLLGVDYELDLTSGELETLEGLLQPYLAVAKRTGGRRSAGRGASSGAAGAVRPNSAAAFTGADSKTVREWAHANGLPCPDRGRIPMATQEAYVEAHRPAPAPEPEAPAASSNGASKPTRRRVKTAEFVAPPAPETEEKPAPRRRRARASS